MDIANTAWLQVLVVLGVPALLLGIIWAGVRAHHWFKRRRTAATLLATELTLEGTSPVPSGSGGGDGEGAGVPEVLADVAELLEPD